VCAAIQAFLREGLARQFEEPTTNGYAEGLINEIKVIKRRADEVVLVRELLLPRSRSM
jgi:hypothetical protein